MWRLLSQQTEYALSVLVELALSPEGTSVQASELGRKLGIPLPSAHQVLVRLRRHGCVCSERGPTGGYSLARDAEEITVGEVISAFAGSAIASPGEVDAPSRWAVRRWAAEVGQAWEALLASETIGGLAGQARRLRDAMALMPGL
jgi:rrf2 family protein (putative transcriptional regulator)